MMIMEITKKAYIDEQYKHCPYCGSDMLSFGPIVEEASPMYRSVTCADCNSAWYEVVAVIDVWEQLE